MMARARNIKPGFFKNEDLAECTPWARLLFPGLWMLADREGRLENRPKRIKGEIFPFDNVDVQSLLDELETWGFIKRYEICGVKCLQIINFIEHQSPHSTEKDSELPSENGFLKVNERSKGAFVTGNFINEPYGKPLDNGMRGGSSTPNNGAITVNPPLDTGATTVNPPLDNALNPDSLNPDSLNPESRKGRAPAAQAPTPPRRRQSQTSLPNDFGISDRVREWALERGYDRLPEHLDAFKRKAVAKGYTYASWDDALMEAIREDWAKVRTQGRQFMAVIPAHMPPEQRAEWERQESEKAKRMLFGDVIPSVVIEAQVLELSHEQK